MRKVNLLKYFVVFLYVLVISRLIYLTIYKNDYYSYKKEDINNNIISIGSYPRGRILDINGNILVDNKGVNSVIYKDDKKINKFDIVDKLYNILEINNINVTKEMKYKYLYDKYKNVFDNRLSIDILNKYNNREITKYDLLNYKYSLIDDSLLDNVNIKKVYLYYLITSGYGYEYKTIKNNISDIELDYINNANIPGISVITNYVRVYNYDTCLNTLFGDIGNIHKEDKEYYLSLGYSLDDIVGVSFLEKYYESYLKGEKSKYKLLENGELELINNYKKGNDLVLNIDINLQMRIEEEVKKEMIETKKYVSSKYYNGSYLVISNPNNGDIISLIGIKYNNGEFTSDVIGLLTNSYTVGSVVKGASLSVGYYYDIIDNKKILDSCVKLYSQKEKCSWKRLGYINDIDALTYSSNYYQFINAIKVSGYKYERNMVFNPTINDFNKYRELFKLYGLGSKSEIDLYEEELGIEGSKISGDLLLNLSIGQYDTYTPLMLSSYINTIANGGNRYKLNLANSIIDNNGNRMYFDKNIIDSIPLSNEKIYRIRLGMRNVITSGTGSSYINSKYNGAGKTGTSETYYNGIETTTKSFVMFAPFDDPEYSLIIISPNISYKNSPNKYKYPINSRLSSKISNILFEK